MPLDFARIHRMAKPTLREGKWKRPQLSLRKLRVLKKLCLIAGGEWQDPPSMVKQAHPIREIPRPGNKHDRTKFLRIVQTKELLAGQQKMWAQQNKVRRDKLKEERDKEWDPMMEMFPDAFVKMQKPPPTESEALELYNLRIAAKERKEKRWAEMLKGGTEQKKKVTREERLAKKDEEKALKREAKKEGKKPAAVAAPAKGGKPATPAKKSVQKKSKEAQAKMKQDKAKAEYAKMKAKKRERKK